MARYYLAVCRQCRRSGEKLMLKGNKCFSKCTFDKRPKPPGPQPARPRRLSDRGTQLREKQKIRYSFGMLEREFRRFFAEAERQPGVTGDSLMLLLERRLDNVVYRSGLADSRAQARQVVRHGHINVGGKNVDIPSYLVKESDVITFKEQSTKTGYYQKVLEVIGSKMTPGWLAIDKKTLACKVVSLPTPGDLDMKLDAQAAVEYYSR
ncbi:MULTISPECIES: 30S ribosomal protein S4 [Dehalogenimonas]|uniref:Small ribosomal subunit protein uS4 n=2 Tax=Dehalogenimonas TaxID=670486 RepID=A0A0W0GFX8_9CHLR|nr:30S ribosomal protein S4 [Dehalogenimonas alkenigignens]KTB47458.1 SSU ribosomal protein S4P [Dehalogenimonas alkenigignens]PVV83482.1 30S ribosomal protein S4 [Dehalogenimonas alkenigignens]